MSLILIYKKFLRAAGRNVFFTIRWVVSRLPYQVFRFLTPFFVVIGKYFVKKKKRVILKNMHTAFGCKKTEQEISVIVDSYFESIGSSMVELVYFLDHPKEIVDKVIIEGEENLDKALKNGRGAVLLSAHFGNFPLMFGRIALAGYKTNYIMHKMKDEQFGKYIFDLSNKNGVRAIYSLPVRQCVELSLKSLRNNQILFILLDQNYGRAGGVFVDFFGHPAATATGPVILSHRSGAPILPAFIVRDGPCRYRITIDPPVMFEAAPYGQLELVRNTAQLTKIIEGYIRRYPHEWAGWMNRRWKSKPAIA